MVLRFQILLTSLTLVIPGIYTWGEVQPDVRFDDTNDRFDITDFVKHQNQYFRGQEPQEEEEDTRRSFNNENEQKNVIDRVYNVITRRNALDRLDDDDDIEAGNRLDRDRLQKLVDDLHGNDVNGRRNDEDVDPEEEILLHYALPINMKVKGFLEVPEEMLA